MNTNLRDMAESIFLTFDFVRPYLPSYLSWLCGENSKQLLATLFILLAFLLPLNLIFKLKVSKFLWGMMKYPFVRATKEAFAEPELKGWIVKLSLPIQKTIFSTLTFLSFLLSVLMLFISWLGWYSAFWTPYDKLKYGSFSYFIFVCFGAFFVFLAIIFFGNTRQYLKLLFLVSLNDHTLKNNVNSEVTISDCNFDVQGYQFKIKTYLLLLVVFLTSLFLSYYLPIDDIFKGIASTPAIAALFAVIYQILRDHISHEKQLEIQQQQNLFNLGVTSHMSQIVFDKHVEFCEKYMEEVHSVIKVLISEGPTEEGRNLSKKLLDIRNEYSTWITNDMTSSLKPFEDAVFQIGSKTRLSQSTSKSDIAQKAYEQAEDFWEKVLGELIDNNSTNDDLAAESIKNRLRDILGIGKLLTLRNDMINKAIKSLERGT